jgi:hypothetical protein
MVFLNSRLFVAAYWGDTWEHSVAGLEDTIADDIIATRGTRLASTEDTWIFASTDNGGS